MENAESDGQQNLMGVSHDLLHGLPTGWIPGLVSAGDSPQVTVPVVQGSLSPGLTTNAASIPVASVAVPRGPGSGMAGHAFMPYCRLHNHQQDPAGTGDLVREKAQFPDVSGDIDVLGTWLFRELPATHKQHT